MINDTDIGGSNDRFPATRNSVFEKIRCNDGLLRQAALNTLISAYWKPIYKHIRIKWQAQSEEAKDLTQGFLTAMLQDDFLERYSSQRAAFRTFLRLCVDGYVSNERKAAGRQKRGGDQRFVSLEFAAADAEMARSSIRQCDEIEYFDRECLRSVFERARVSLQAACETSGKAIQYTLFERYDLHSSTSGQRPSYEQLATEFDLPITQVTNHLAWIRRRFRRCSFDALRELTGNEEEFKDEARRLFGAVP